MIAISNPEQVCAFEFPGLHFCPSITIEKGFQKERNKIVLNSSRKLDTTLKFHLRQNSWPFFDLEREVYDLSMRNTSTIQNLRSKA
ncbi:hypothetical protein L1887_25523 [Cichorium endivia]|nr:hypothetical protein L1887_25523 [Cichorium endivia]